MDHMAKTGLLPIYIRRHIKNKMASMRLPSLMAIFQKFANLEIIEFQSNLRCVKFNSVQFPNLNLFLYKTVVPEWDKKDEYYSFNTVYIQTV